MPVDGIDPAHRLGLFDRFDVEIDGDGLTIAAHQHAFQRLVGVRIDFLVRNIGRHVDEIAGTCFRNIFQMFAPAHARTALYHIDHAFEVPVMMGSGLGIGMNGYGAGPEFLGPYAGEIDGGLAIHSGRLRRIGVEFATRDDAYAVMLPAMIMIVGHIASKARLPTMMARGIHFRQALLRFEADCRMPVDPNLSREEVWMRRSALHYLGQRSTSIANLRQILKRRARRNLGADADAAALIERTVEYCARNGFVDDAAFVEGRVNAGRSRGLSMRHIAAALQAKGVDRDLVAEAFATEDRRELEERAAARLAKRKRIGPWRRLDREYDTEKEIAVLARGGFAISLARRIVTGAPEEVQALLGA